MLPDFHTLFPHSAPINGSAATVDTRMDWPAIPAKCAVYLLACGDSGEEPLLLATVGNLRAALQRRLADAPPDTHTKRVAYGQICTRLHWRIVHSPFAANWWYWNASRTLFPDRYRELLGWHPSWWIAVDQNTPFPKLRRTQDLSDPSLSYAGPIRDRTAAGKLIDTLEDLFDLCRYHHILLQAPHGKACAYKEMGKCPAPCDGSVPLSWYEVQMHAAFNFVTGDAAWHNVWRVQEEERMRTAASALAFEQAARIKLRIERARLIQNEAYAHLQPLAHFNFLALQPGPGRTNIEPWWVSGGQIECWPTFKRKDLETTAPTLIAKIQERLKEIPAPIDTAATEQIGIVAHHLFRGEHDPGFYVRTVDVLAGGPEFLTQETQSFLERKKAPLHLPEQASDRVPTEETSPPAETELPIATVVSPEADR
jgi:excinuclease UvrABC nuclease subunit